MGKRRPGKFLTLLAATAVVGVLVVVGWIYWCEIRARYLLWRDL